MSLALAKDRIPDVLRFFSRFGVEVGLLVPTETGLSHAIMDAHASLREFLKRKGIHDYADQGQGQDSKKIVNAHLITLDGPIKKKVSLYRPATKKGDPRIWIEGLNKHAAAGDILALMIHDGELFVVNSSTPGLLDLGSRGGTFFHEVLEKSGLKEIPVAAVELLRQLRNVSAMGYVRTMRPGPTGVGFTLESLLGIKANSHRGPDIDGIEIKAGRATDSGRRKTRTTLFSRAPNWDASPYGALQLLRTYGRPNRNGRNQIYCSLRNVPNPTFGFYLRVEDSHDELTSRRGIHGSAPTNSDEEIFSWPMRELQSALLEKHSETFWVKAKTKGIGQDEHFLYYEVTHTRRPLISNFAALIESGHINLDFLLKVEFDERNNERARDRGYLFKIWERDRDLLFTSAITHSLA